MTKRKKLKTYDKQRDAVDRYRANNPQKGIGATFAEAEKNYISSIFKRHGVKPSEILRGAAAALRDGQPIRTEREPLPIPAEYANSQTDDRTEPTDTADSTTTPTD